MNTMADVITTEPPSVHRFPLAQFPFISGANAACITITSLHVAPSAKDNTTERGPAVMTGRDPGNRAPRTPNVLLYSERF
jgi:hypothetical protein